MPIYIYLYIEWNSARVIQFFLSSQYTLEIRFRVAMNNADVLAAFTLKTIQL